MAYDIIRHTQTPENFARGDAPITTRSFVLTVLELCVAGAAIALPEIQRQRENARYRRDFSTDRPIRISHKDQPPTYIERRVHVTQEMPAIPMSEFDFSRMQRG